MNLPIGIWLLYLEGVTYSVILCFVFSPIHSHLSEPSWCTVHTVYDTLLEKRCKRCHWG